MLSKSVTLNPRSAGFTLIELLTTVGVVSILIALLIPAVQSTRESARRVQCSHRLRQIGLALHQYESSNRVFPPGLQTINFRGPTSWSKAYGWTVAVMPELELGSIYSKFDFNRDLQIHHRTLTAKTLNVFVCPSDPIAHDRLTWTPPLSPEVELAFGKFYEGPWGATNYLGVSGNSALHLISQPSECQSLAIVDDGLHAGIFFGNSSVATRGISDGLSNTTLVGERAVTREWGKWAGGGRPNECPAGVGDVTLPMTISRYGVTGGLRSGSGHRTDVYHWWSWHPQGCNFLLADASVRILSYKTDLKIQIALGSRNGGEILGEF